MNLISALHSLINSILSSSLGIRSIAFRPTKNWKIIVKFVFFEKATKLDKISILLLTNKFVFFVSRYSFQHQSFLYFIYFVSDIRNVQNCVAILKLLNICAIKKKNQISLVYFKYCKLWCLVLSLGTLFTEISQISAKFILFWILINLFRLSWSFLTKTIFAGFKD